MFIFMQDTQTLTVGGSMELDVNLFVLVGIEWTEFEIPKTKNLFLFSDNAENLHVFYAFI